MAEFAYDALASRIKKRDSIADTNNIYYYNNNWSASGGCDYNDSGTLQRWFAYGNYIDEVLMSGSESTFYYIHDHLYSPVALITTAGAVSERYEYDAYGNCHILEPNFAPDPDGKSDYENPYLFTGRRVDILDSGSLTIQYNRNRYYDQYSGRWLTHDPLGITPNPHEWNRFDITVQYWGGLSLYEYVRDNPVLRVDASGLERDIYDPPVNDPNFLPSPYPPDPREPDLRSPYERDIDYVRLWTRTVWDRSYFPYRAPCVKEFHVYGHGTISPTPGVKHPTDARQSIGYATPRRYLRVVDLPNGQFCCRAMVKLWGCYVGNNSMYMRALSLDIEELNRCKKVKLVACTRDVKLFAWDRWLAIEGSRRCDGPWVMYGGGWRIGYFY